MSAPSTPGWPRPESGHPGAGSLAWGLTEMWIQDPDGIRIVLVEVPADHPLRRDPRSASPPSDEPYAACVDNLP